MCKLSQISKEFQTWYGISVVGVVCGVLMLVKIERPGDGISKNNKWRGVGYTQSRDRSF